MGATAHALTPASSLADLSFENYISHGVMVERQLWFFSVCLFCVVFITSAIQLLHQGIKRRQVRKEIRMAVRAAINILMLLVTFADWNIPKENPEKRAATPTTPLLMIATDACCYPHQAALSMRQAILNSPPLVGIQVILLYLLIIACGCVHASRGARRTRLPAKTRARTRQLRRRHHATSDPSEKNGVLSQNTMKKVVYHKS